MNKNNKFSSVKNQQGAALMVSMVLIFMLTILGISAMREATLEGQLAANAIQKEITFQSAESAADIVMAIEDAANAMSPVAVICKPKNEFDMNDLSVPDVQETKVSVEYGGQSLPIGYSLGGQVGGRRFVVTGESNLPGASTGTRIAQGIIEIGAAEQGVDC